MKKVYITTPAYYPNNVPHLGHSYTTIVADILARWYRLKLDKKDVMFISGLDEHGEKIEKIAREKGMEPQEFVDMMAKKFKDTWKLLNISYNGFIRTSEKKHIEVVNKIFKKIYDSGDIYKDFYEGWYCVPCESYWTELQVENGKCPECGRDVDSLTEESYFFKLSKYQGKLLELYEKNPDFISPEHRKKEIINRVNDGLRDISVSRKKVKWGIPVPIDKDFTIYCWIDALSFYLSVLDYPSKKFEKFWSPDIQLMAKEILWFHAVILPALLMSAKISLPKRIFAHGWLTVDGEKMSKSKGNFIIPQDMVKKYGVDAFRYFLVREIPFGQDGDFSEEALKARINGELLADLGNLVSRVLTLVEKNRKVRLKGENELVKRLDFKKIDSLMENFEISLALEEIWKFIRESNKYVNENEPWKLEGERLGEVLCNLVEAIRIISILVSAFIPETAEKINKQLGVKQGDFKDLEFKAFRGKIKKGELLFKKV